MKRKSARCFLHIEHTVVPRKLGITTSSGHGFHATYTYEKSTDVEVGAFRFVEGTSDKIKDSLLDWMSQFKSVSLWVNEPGDIDTFIEVMDFDLPEDIEWNFCNLSDMFDKYGFDKSIDREAFIDTPVEGDPNSALYQCQVIELCYDKFYRNKERYNDRLKFNRKG